MKIGEEKNEEIAEVRKKETDEKKEKMGHGPRRKKREKLWAILEKLKNSNEIGLGLNLFEHPRPNGPSVMDTQAQFQGPKSKPNPYWAPKNPKPNLIRAPVTSKDDTENS
jgi:hypothetical protein